MKNFRLVFIIALLIAAIFAINSCKEDENPVDNDKRDVVEEVIQETYGTARVTGFVVDKEGLPLSGVTVYFGTHESITDGEGKYELTEVSEGSRKRIWFEKEGYALNQKLVDVREDLPNRIDAALFPIAATAEIGEAGGMIEGDDFSVEIQPGGFVYSDGVEVEGEVTVSVTPFLTSEDNFIDAFPGDFMGTRTDGSTTGLESFGFIDVDLRDKDGEKVQMAEGVTAIIKITAPANAPQTIPRWWYDTEKAEWIEEGAGSLVNGEYVAEVSHFTAWNWDIPVELRSTIIGRVVDNAGNPIEGASIVQTGKTRAFRRSTKSNENGSFQMYTLENLETVIEAQFDIYGSTIKEFKTSENSATVNDIGDMIIDISFENIIPPFVNNDTLYITMGDIATIRGKYFGSEKKENYKLLVNGAEVSTLSWNKDAIKFEVPVNIPTEGTIQIDRDGSLSRQTPYVDGDWFCEIDGVIYDNSSLPITNRGKDLRLSGYNLKSLPDCIGNLTNLENLSIGYNQLTALPEPFGNLINLRYLNLYENQLTTLPESFGNLTNLEFLDLRNNQLTTLPESFGNLINFDTFDLRFNQLTSLPESFGNLTNLEVLDLRFNQLTSLPESFGNLTNLENLDLRFNQLTSLPESIKNLINLKRLLLSGNNITDSEKAKIKAWLPNTVIIW